MSESDRQSNGETGDRTFDEEQKPLFESDYAADKTRQRTPGTQSVPPSERTGETGEVLPGVSDAG